MSDISLATQGTPATPAAGTGVVYLDSTSKETVNIDDGGKAKTLRTLTNTNTADVTANAADTYLTGSSITVPPALLHNNAKFRWTFRMTKSGAGVATDIWNLRIGTAGTVADVARATFTMGAQTAVIDDGWAVMEMVVRSGGGTATCQIEVWMYFWHTLTTTGLNSVQMQSFQSTPATFDATVQGLIVGISNNPGASGVWTFQHITAEATNM